MQENKEPIVTLQHARQLKVCARGLKAVAIATIGEEGWKVFVKKGIPASALEGSKHPQIVQAVALAKQEFEGSK